MLKPNFAVKLTLAGEAVTRYLWDEECGCFRDYDWRREQLALFSAASIVTPGVGMATHAQAERLADAVRARLLTPGGIMATEYESGEQWDKPNGWAPLQWMAVQGFKMYGHDPLGDEIAQSWLQTVNQFYLKHHKLIEKYHIASGVPHEGGGGEYPLQDGWLDQRRGAAAYQPVRRAEVFVRHFPSAGCAAKVLFSLCQSRQHARTAYAAAALLAAAA